METIETGEDGRGQYRQLIVVQIPDETHAPTVAIMSAVVIRKWGSKYRNLGKENNSIIFAIFVNVIVLSQRNNGKEACTYVHHSRIAHSQSPETIETGEDGRGQYRQLIVVQIPNK